VLAALKPVPGLAGRSIDELADDAVQLPVSKKLREALKDAAAHLRAHEQKSEPQPEAESPSDPGTLAAITPG